MVRRVRQPLNLRVPAPFRRGGKGRGLDSRNLLPRRILADFLIGAHALRNGFPLLTLDDRIYRAAFPGLIVVTI